MMFWNTLWCTADKLAGRPLGRQCHHLDFQQHAAGLRAHRNYIRTESDCQRELISALNSDTKAETGWHRRSLSRWNLHSQRGRRHNYCQKTLPVYIQVPRHIWTRDLKMSTFLFIQLQLWGRHERQYGHKYCPQKSLNYGHCLQTKQDQWWCCSDSDLWSSWGLCCLITAYVS